MMVILNHIFGYLSNHPDLICAMISVFVTIFIGCLQVRQGHQMKKLEMQQIEADNKRHEEFVEIQARQFLVKYAECIGLLPLCAIAFVYDKKRAYSRAMYSEFRLLPKDVRLKIFEYCDWPMCDVESDDFFRDCLKCLESAIVRFLPKDDFHRMFYQNGKYIERAILYYANNSVSYPEFISELTDILVVSFRNDEWDDYKSSVINEIIERFHFSYTDEITACEIACVTAQYIGIYSGRHILQDTDKFIDFGSPGSWSGEEIETMEDLFLLTLFEIWSNLWRIKD